MIVASFQSEYGIRLATDLSTMSWAEFSYLISGLSGDSPLGRIINIRAEKDPDMLKSFTPEQHRIRNEYRKKQAFSKSKEEVDNAVEALKNAFIKMAK